MKYYSTNNKNLRVSFREAVLSGIAPDGGLYMPEIIPVLPDALIGGMDRMALDEIAGEVIRPFVQPMDDQILNRIVRESISFPAPLIKLTDRLSILELWHGPTLAFKDFGARFLAGMLGEFLQQEKKDILILVATSGDTGSAVAGGFYGMPGIKVGLLYPHGKVSWIQEKQLTTTGGNVLAFEVNGSFDDCQMLVKKAFADGELARKYYLTSANSINICRLLPQMFYYFYGVSRMDGAGNPPTICVPSGNFGNLTAGIISWKMGLPAEGFIAAVNANRVFADYLTSGVYQPKPAVQTLSNAMDVGDPSNFHRISDLFGGGVEEIRRLIKSYSISDKETRAGIREVHDKYDYRIDPHGAVGYQAIKKDRTEHNGDSRYILLETAHPAKFNDVMEDVLGVPLEYPERLAESLKKQKSAISVGKDYKDFKDNLIRVISG